MKTSRLATTVFSTLLLTALATSPALAADKTFTGKVSDAMCGAKHQMAGNDASCTRTCVHGGSKYALVVGDKVYTLETTDNTALDKLGELAGTSAKVPAK